MSNMLRRARAAAALRGAGGQHLSILVCIALAALAAACDATPPGPPPAEVRGTAQPAIVAPGSTAHELYLEKGFACADCHPCGVKDPQGHEVPWMQASDAGFHALSANQGLSSCQVCHGPALDGAAGTTRVSCAQCHGAGWETDCTMCHGGVDDASGAPPRTTWGNSADPVRAGAHAAHLRATLAGPIGCATCHAVPADAFTLGHVDGGTAEVTFEGLPALPAGPPAWDRETATCSNVYCHGGAGGTATSPSWTSVDGSQRACGACHGAPPPAPHTANPECGACHEGYGADAVNLETHVNGALDVKDLSCSSCHGSAANAAPPMGTMGETDPAARAVGAHQQHLVAGTLRGPMACEECHAVPAAMDHADGAVQLAFGPLARAYGAEATFDPVSLGCSTYCHGAVLRGGGTGAEPVWTGGPSQVACGSCHLTPPPAPHPRTAVCDNCHPGYTLGSVDLATHVNGVIDAENLTCDACHGDTTRVLVMQADPLATAAPPYGSRGELDPASRSVGRHQAHVNRGDGLALPNKCRYCHAVPAEGDFDHANGVSEVTFGSLATMDDAAPTFDGNTCAGTYCHGATLGRGGTDHAPRWTDPDAVTCGSCHGVPPPAPHPQDPDCIRCHPGYTATSVRKWTHVNGVSDFPSGCNSCHDMPPNTGEHYEHLHERVACYRCHEGYTLTTANETLHRNARQDVTVSGWNPATRTCASNGCHGSEYWGRTGTAARTSCNQCHGVPPRSGEHEEHREYACSRCHGTGFTTTTTNTAVHLNGVVDVPFAFYSRSTRTCSGTGCHGSESWGSTSPVTPNCANCHGFPPPLPHPQGADCQTCHPSMQSTGVLTAAHNDGTLDIAGTGCATCHGFPPTSTRQGGLHTTDANCYGCHSTSVDASNQVVPNGTHNDGWVQVGGGGVGTYGCQSCHGDPARAATAGADPNLKSAPPLGTRGETEPTTRAVGAHLAHVSPAAVRLAGPASCDDCHVVPTAMDHATGEVVVAFGARATAAGATPAWEPATLTCASTYCHGATLGAGGTNHLPSWTGGAGEATCGSCHGAPPPPPHAVNPDCGACHQGYSATSVNLATHVDGVVQSASHGDGYADAALHGADANALGLAGCATCHGADLGGGTAGVSCNACHAGAGHAAWDASCTFCHGDRVAELASPPPDVRGGTSRASVTVGAHAAHLGASLSGPVGCGECHPARAGSVLADAAHVDGDGVAEVAFGAIARTGGAAPVYARASEASATCASTWCHGAAAVEWTSTAPLGCTSCHGAPPPAPHSTSTACGNCHPGYTATTVNRATHVDGVVQATSNHPAGYADPAAHGLDANLGGLASCKTCHGVDLAGGSGPSCATCHAAAGVAAWETSCTFCHGSTVTGRANPPVDVRGRSAATYVSVGVHEAHATSAIAVVGCEECHPARTASVVADAAHLDGDGRAEVQLGALARTGGAAATYSRTSDTSATCASTYCHGRFTGGTGATVSWTSTTQVTCTSCHGSPPSTGEHKKHVSDKRIGCQVCHASVVSSSTVVVGKALHANGADDVKFGGTHNSRTVTGTWNPSTRTCSSLSCHGSKSW